MKKSLKSQNDVSYLHNPPSEWYLYVRRLNILAAVRPFSSERVVVEVVARDEPGTSSKGWLGVNIGGLFTSLRCCRGGCRRRARDIHQRFAGVSRALREFVSFSFGGVMRCFRFTMKFPCFECRACLISKGAEFNTNMNSRSPPPPAENFKCVVSMHSEFG